MKRRLTKIKREINQKGSGIKKIWAVVLEFSSDTSIHGIRYFTEHRRHWSERLFWIVAVTLSIYFCGSSIREIVIDWHKNPIKLEFTDKPASLSSIPFPSVSICPTVIADSKKVDADNIEDFIQKGENTSDGSVHAQAHAAAMICNMSFQNETEALVNGNLLEQLEHISPSMFETFSHIRWKLRPIPADESLIAHLTPYGRCFTFNGLNSHEMYTKGMVTHLMESKNDPNKSNWSVDHGYHTRVDDTNYPRHISNALSFGALRLTLRQSEKNLRFKCFEETTAFRLFLHSPGELPIPIRPIRIYPSETTMISVKPKLITTSSRLRSYTPKQRQCFYNSERRLGFYQIYTQRNCMAECFSNYTKSKFGCLNFYMTRDHQTNVCTKQIKKDFQFYQVFLQFSEEIEDVADEEIKSFRKKCNCLQACTSITYNAEIERDQLRSKNGAEGDEFQVSNLSIFFKNEEVTSLRRRALYTFENFLAIGGGLMGLFLGVSILSIVELIYYFTLRLFWNIRRWKKDRVQPNRAKIISVISRNVPPL